MLQRRLSVPFDCRVRSAYLEEKQITEFSSWLDREFQLGDDHDTDPPPDYRLYDVDLHRHSFLWPNRLSFHRRSQLSPYPPPTPPPTLCSLIHDVIQRQFIGLQQFWGSYISFDVPIKHSRDHLALEKTFFAYIRTSASLAMMGVTVAQLLTLQHSPAASPTFGFHVIGKPIACACQVAAIIITLVGTARFWIQQDAVLRGKVWSGGWDTVILGSGFLMGAVTLFVLFTAIDIEKEIH